MLTDLTEEPGSFWVEAAIDCLRDISDGMISVELRHSNFNLLATDFFFQILAHSVFKM